VVVKNQLYYNLANGGILLMTIDQHKFKQARQAPLADDHEELLTDTNSLLAEEQSTDISPVAAEGTPVDPVAPPTEIVNGTDLLNGYNGTAEDQ
jgi:hypothetical protein